MFVPTYSVWHVILFRETSVVHRITHIFSYFFLFTNLLLGTKKTGAVKSHKQITFYSNNMVTGTYSQHARTRLLSSLDCRRPLSRLNFSPYHPSYH